MPEIAVYLGPSLRQSEAVSILDATYLPPICRGDIARLPKDVGAVGIVDGEFFQSLAVSPKEILFLLDRGVRVFGASSMGALRAAETRKFGTVGVGEIFEMYRDGVLDGDDEVALAYDRETNRHFSEPLVNIRCALQMAVEQGAIDEIEMQRLIQRMKQCYFPERSYRALQNLCPALGDFLQRTKLPDLKRDDARQMLVAMQRWRDDPNPG